MELEELGSIREMQLKESEASGKISGLEKKIQYAEIEKVTGDQHYAMKTYRDLYGYTFHRLLWFRQSNFIYARVFVFLSFIDTHFLNYDLFKNFFLLKM